MATKLGEGHYHVKYKVALNLTCDQAMVEFFLKFRKNIASKHADNSSINSIKMAAEQAHF